jgi:hypothetical protein
MPEALGQYTPDTKTRRTKLPTLVADRCADVAYAHKTTMQRVYQTAVRLVAYYPPDGPVAYPSVIHASRSASDTSIRLSLQLYEVCKYLERRYFYERLPWLLLYGTSIQPDVFAHLLALDAEALAELDVRRYNYWSSGGQPLCIPTTARAPGVKARRASR